MLYSTLMFVVKGLGDLGLLWFYINIYIFWSFVFAYYIKQKSCNERYCLLDSRQKILYIARFFCVFK